MSRFTSILLAIFFAVTSAVADDGYRLWLRYDRIEDPSLLQQYQAGLREIVIRTPAGEASAMVRAAQAELQRGLEGLIGLAPSVRVEKAQGADLQDAEAFVLKPGVDDKSCFEISGGGEAGALYGAFALLRHVQTQIPVEAMEGSSAPAIDRRILNHWDNLDRTVERGTAGFSLWNWFELPDYADPRYTDYARACASVGINGTVLTNVNANALVLTPDYIRKVARLAEVFRPYNLKIYLTARFSAPVEIGGLKTADPAAPEVAAWWAAKADEIYNLIPDFGGFLVKANSEGQPGPQDYNRTHAEGANMLADAVAPHGGIVMWRAFVYSHEVPDDRAKQAYSEFKPLDGTFRDNVVVQIKNGPIDFMPREPFHPLFGAMPKTSLGLELQITQEYLGASTHLAFLGPLFEEVLDSDTFASGPGSTVGDIVSGKLDGHGLSVIAGVANTGTDRNWTGHPLAASNWYAFGRLAWDYNLSSEQIAEEWTRMTFGNRLQVMQPIVGILLESREAVVNYMMPLGLHHIMAEGHHYGPGPWVDQGRPDWTSVYYHRADKNGVGFDRTRSGSNAVSQYFAQVAAIYGSIDTVPEELLLWFHHVPWDHRMQSGRTLWDELALRYQQGVDTVREWQATWKKLEDQVDAGQWHHVNALLERQEREARQWRDACLLYFQTFSGQPLPEGVEPPEHDLNYYKSIKLNHFPGDPAG